MTRPLLLAALLAGCAAPGATTKGGFVALDTAPERFRPAQRKLVLAIGVERYRADGGWHDLRFPGQDARAVVSTLAKRGGFERVDIAVGEVARGRVLSAFDRLAAANRDPSDVVVVYVSAHGTLARDHSGRLRRYLVTSESTMADVPGSALSMATLTQRFDALASRRKVLVLASCHAGEGKSALPPTLVAELATYKSAFFPPPPPLEGVSRASFVIGASGWGEPAREDPALGHDVYTYYFLEAVRRPYDPDGDGAVTVTEAHDFARRLTYQRSGGAQRPYLRSDILGGDPIVLAGSPGAPALPLLLSFDPALEGYRVRVDGHEKGALPGGLALPVGDHEVSIESPQGTVVASRSLSLAPRQRLLVEDLLAGDPPPDWSASAGMSWQAFLDSRSRARLVEPVPLASLTVSRLGTLGGRLRLFGELQLTPGSPGSSAQLTSPSGDVADVPYRLTEVSAGIGGAYTLAAGDRLTFALGPVLSAWWFARRFDVAGMAADESYFTFVPSLDVGLRYRAWRGLVLSAGLRESFIAFRVDDATRLLAMGQAGVGLGWEL